MHIISIQKRLILSTFFFALFFCSSGAIFAQAKKSFSLEPAKFVTEFGDFFAASKSKDVLELKKTFSKEFGTLYTPEEQDTIIAFVNTMKSLRFNAKPDFVNYVQLIASLKKDANRPAGLAEWHQVAKEILAKDKKPKKTLKSFIKFMAPFLADHAFKDKKRGGIIWMTKGGSYKVNYKENDLYLEFSDIDLLSLRRSDSLIIAKTKGVYHLKTNEWKGKGGKVSWEKAGLGSDVFATLSSYRIDCSKGLYDADSVELMYPFLLSKPMLGRLTDKVSKSTEKSTYPKFVSYADDFIIKNVGPGIELVGGVKIDGAKIYIKADKGRKASFSYHKPQSSTLLFKCHGKSFSIKKEQKIYGGQVETSIYFKQDSIYHPSVSITYLMKENELKLSRADRGSDRNPFFNSFYQVNIDVNKISYNVNQEKILVGDKGLSIDKIENEVTFESVNFYDESTYIRYRGVSTTNPIAVLLRLATATGEKEFDESEVAYKINPNVKKENNKRLLYQLASDGFIFYDSDNGKVVLRDKLFHYGRASTGNTDYDPINVVSKSKDANAVFDLKSGKTEIQDVKTLELSRKQQVAIKPQGKKLNMLKNRDMNFDGLLYAGMAVFYGKDMRFNYGKFNVVMDSVRYLDFYVPTGKVLKNKRKEAVSMDSRIEYATGYLLVDAPQNKSGKKIIKMFPSFASKDYSFVYYDRDDIQHGVYKRDSFYFRLNKFTFNSLDDYKKEDLSFKGTMFSADILPEFKESIVVRDDLSWGFVNQTPAAGLPLYANRGKYTGEVDLSNKGFFGKGLVNYLTASIRSEDLLFKPRVMFGTAKEFNMTEDRASEIKVPQVVGDEVKVHWKPYSDSMYVTTKEKPFDVFKQPNYTMNGTLVLTPKGAKGKGLFDWDGGDLKSKLMDLGPFTVRADTADLRIKAIGEAGIALNTNNLNSFLDFDHQIGKFKANNDSVVTTLPQNKYATTMNQFDWDMTKGIINFKSKPGTTATFTSIHEQQDSLTFQGETAMYNLKTAELNIGGVPSIVSCDATIFPADGKVDIKVGAQITTLENARIVADTSNKYHEFTEVTVDIMGRKDYKAKGNYLYNLPSRDQKILFENIIGQRYGKGAYSEKPTLTTATTEVDEGINFYIDEKTKFKGTISLRANEKKLDFDGFGKLDVSDLNGKWFSIHSKGDKKNLVIALDKPKTPEGDPLSVGIFLSKETAAMYPRILMPLRLRKDRPIIDCMGEFKYDKTKKAFIFGDSTRVRNFGDKGNKLVYFTNNNVVKADGKLNLGSGLQMMNIDAAGVLESKMSRNIDSSELVVSLMAGLEFKFPEALVRVISADIESSLLDLKDGVYENSFYNKVLPNMIPKQKDLIKAKKSINSRSLDLPKSFSKYQVFFSKLNMKWYPDYQSFMTTSKKNIMGAFAGKPVNKSIRSYVEFKMPSNDDDRVYIYFKLPNDNFYFFGYQGGILSTCSNNEVFNTTAEKMKSKAFTFKMKKKGTYVVEVVNPLTAQLFVKRVNTAVNGVK